MGLGLGFMTVSEDLEEDGSSLMTVSDDADLSDIGIGEWPKIGGSGPVRLEDLVIAAVGFTAGQFREDREISMVLGVVLRVLLMLSRPDCHLQKLFGHWVLVLEVLLAFS